MSGRPWLGAGHGGVDGEAATRGGGSRASGEACRMWTVSNGRSLVGVWSSGEGTLDGDVGASKVGSDGTGDGWWKQFGVTREGVVALYDGNSSKGDISCPHVGVRNSYVTPHLRNKGAASAPAPGGGFVTPHLRNKGAAPALAFGVGYTPMEIIRYGYAHYITTCHR